MIRGKSLFATEFCTTFAICCPLKGSVKPIKEKLYMEDMINGGDPRKKILIQGYLRNSEKAYADGDFQWVISLLSRVIVLDPRQPAHLLNRGMARMELKQYEQALEDFAKAVEIDPDYTYAHTNRAVALERVEDLDGALKSYGRAVALEPDNADLYYNRAIALAQWGRCNDAIDDFTKAIELDPENADFFNNRANARADMGDYQSALTDFTKAIEIDPADTVLYDNRGITYGKLGLMEEALADYEMSALLEPRIMNKHLSKIEAEIILFRWRDARISLERCRSLEPLEDDIFNFCFMEVVLLVLEGGWKKDITHTLKELHDKSECMDAPISWDYDDLKTWIAKSPHNKIDDSKKEFLTKLMTQIESFQE